MTIVEFLEARLAEDELTASAAIDGTADWHAVYTHRDVKDGDGHYVVLADSRYPTVGQAAHIARHSSARVLRQCEAARAVIADFLRLDALGDLPGGPNRHRGLFEATCLRILRPRRLRPALA